MEVCNAFIRNELFLLKASFSGVEVNFDAVALVADEYDFDRFQFARAVSIISAILYAKPKEESENGSQ